MKKAILAVSFGTTHEDSIEKCISALEKDFAEKYPDSVVVRAFSSSIVKKVLHKRGIEVDNIEQALQRIVDDGYESVIIQPTHLISGEEFDKLCNMAENFKEKFAEFKIGVPFFNSDEDMECAVRFFHEKLCSGDNMLVMMGHGSEHSANSTYARLNEICLKLGFNDMFIGTVEAKPDLDDALSVLNKSDFKKVTLTPLLLVAGDHAKNDMAGDDDSWKSILEAEGFEVNAVIKGMGEYSEIREIYVRHLASIMEGLN